MTAKTGIVPKGHLLSIASLRGWAIFMVMAVHWSQGFPGLSPLAQFIANNGARGVQLFFVLSAFSLCLSWDRSGDGAIPFYIRRFFRIAPLFWLAIAVCVIAFGVRDVPHIAATAAFLHGFYPPYMNSLVPGCWSIADEMVFYALFPALFFLTRRPRLALAAIAVMAYVYATYYGHLVDVATIRIGFTHPLWGDYLFLFLPAQLPVFLWGFVAYHIYKTGKFENATNGITAALAVLAIAALAATQPPFWRFIPFRNLFGLSQINLYAFLFAFTLLCAVRGKAGFMVSNAMAFIGERSFSAYLIHFLVIDLSNGIRIHDVNLMDRIQGLNGGLAGFAGTFPFFIVATVALSALTYRLIEQPGIRAGRRYAKAWSSSQKSVHIP